MSLINVGIGVSQKDNLIEAVREAAECSKKELGQRKKPKILMFFCTYTYPLDRYQEAQKVIYEVFDNDREVPLVGGSTMGFFAKDRYFFDVSLMGDLAAFFLKGMGKIIKPLKFNGVAVLSLTSDYINVGVGMGLDAEKDPKKAGKESIQQALNNLQYNPSVAYLAMLKRGARDITKFRPLSGFLLAPGTNSQFNLFDQKILDGITELTRGTVRLAGGGMCSGQKIWPLGGYHFFNGKVFYGSVISILFGSELEIGYGVATGLTLLKEKFVVTRIKDYKIYEINDRPAVDIIKDVMSKYIKVNEKNLLESYIKFSQMGYVFSFPDLKEDFYWPFPFVEFKKEYVTSMILLREGMGISLGKLSKESAQNATADAVKMMIEDSKSKDFGLILFASCAARGLILGSKYFKEIEIIKKTLKQENLPVFGICSSGEQAFYKTGLMMGASLIVTIMGVSNRLIASE